MKTPIPLYEGDGYIHYQEGRTAESPAPARPSDAAQAVDFQAIEHARELRSVAVGEAFHKFAAWLVRKLRDAQRSEVDAYLSQSTDLADLEQRLKHIEHRNGFNFG
ncbi:MAG: DUF3563 family protein [Burkholderiales bacterium]